MQLSAKWVFICTLYALLPITTIKAQNANNYTNNKALIHIDISKVPKTAYSINIIEHNDGTYGYDIMINHQIYFHQPYFPGSQKGFSTKLIAEAVAKNIIMKLHRRNAAPMLSKEELLAHGLK